ncbi:hypothetical protein [Bacillus massilinigeriensis]|uniref:hypothetical protein n=1 Tax=Bacillus massilionigeriensis TaxID=1805475 RepID=UPI00096AFDB5|nr:hypothetical protein [Bacillus massilionigeriensis]
MKGLLVLVVALFIYLSILFTDEKTTDEIVIDNNIKQILFFSKETNFDDEASYYDAIIELKKQFPNEVNNMLIISSDDAKEYLDEYDVKECPAIVVVYQNKVLTSVDGQISKEKIIKPIKNALSKELY